MKFFEFVLCFLLTLSSIHGITVYKNSNLNKRSPKPYHSYIEFEDKREGGGYGYKFQVEGNHAEQEVHINQQKLKQTNPEEDKTYLLGQNYEELPPYQHHPQQPTPHRVNQPNVYINQELEPEPQIVFESNIGQIRHEKQNKVPLNNYPLNPDINLQSFPNLFFPNHEQVNPSNSEPVKLSQLPIITKYVQVPGPVKYIPVPVKESAMPSRGHIKYNHILQNASPSKPEPVIVMKPNIDFPAKTPNAPVKYIMIPVQPSSETNPKNMYGEHIPKQLHYKQNQEHILHHQYTPNHIQNQNIYESISNEENQEIKQRLPVKPVDNSMQEIHKVKHVFKYVPQNFVENQIQSNNQFVYKYNEDLSKSNEDNYREYLPNRLAHPVAEKQVAQYHKANTQEANIPPVEGQPMYEYKTIQEEDLKNPQSGIEYEMLNMPELVNKLPVNIDFSHKFVPQSIPLHNEQSFMLQNNVPAGMNFGAMNNLQLIGKTEQFKQFSDYTHGLMPNFNFGIKRRSTKGKDETKPNQKKYSKLQVKNN